MVKRASIEFNEVTAPILETVTKFGGQPNWLSTPQWPLGRNSSRPMRFICQVALDPALFGSIVGRMAYIFMTDIDEDVSETWEPDSGENAVIVQPGDALVSTQELSTGPTLYRMVHRNGQKLLAQQECEFAVQLKLSEDPDFISETDLWQLEKDVSRKYLQALVGNKVGGTPGFLQADEFPAGEFRKLLLQLDSTKVPFAINFGDAGIGYAFLSSDGSSGRFLWQCC